MKLCVQVVESYAKLYQDNYDKGIIQGQPSDRLSKLASKASICRRMAFDLRNSSTLQSSVVVFFLLLLFFSKQLKDSNILDKGNKFHCRDSIEVQGKPLSFLLLLSPLEYSSFFGIFVVAALCVLLLLCMERLLATENRLLIGLDQGLCTNSVI